MPVKYAILLAGCLALLSSSAAEDGSRLQISDSALKSSPFQDALVQFQSIKQAGMVYEKLVQSNSEFHLFDGIGGKEYDEKCWDTSAVTVLFCQGFLWRKLGVDDRPIEPMFEQIFDGKFSRDDCKRMVVGLMLFRESHRNNPGQTWDYLVSRSSKPSNMLDWLVMTWLFHGDKVRLLPGDVLPALDIEYGEDIFQKPGAPNNWLVSPPSPSDWLVLYDGSNAVYRIMAAHAMQAWVPKEKIEVMLFKALRDPYFEIRRAALKQIDLLPLEKQFQLLLEYVKRENSLPAVEPGMVLAARKELVGKSTRILHEIQRKLPQDHPQRGFVIP